MVTRLFLILALTILSLAAEQRKLHRLVGGHLRIINPDSDDSELMTSASGGKNKKTKHEEEEKKTLSQQVADGKYGLIQKELFSKPPKRQGILSYDSNSEVPKDNVNTLGGLSKNEIWLAEDHLLVIRGGTYPLPDDRYNNDGSAWPPIDDYSAPLHQVKIPKHPKVPPPFPVQLTKDGPIQILGTNSSRTLNGTAEASAYALPPPTGWEPGTGPFFPPPEEATNTNSPNVTSGKTQVPIFGKVPGEYDAGVPFPPYPLNGTLPPYFNSLPPGATIVPAPGNQTEPFDEDDQSIYYPPPYSFFYPKDNSSTIAAGPLVPGIILPPPPNFFAPLEEQTTSTIKPQHRITEQPKPHIKNLTTSVSAKIIRNKSNKGAVNFSERPKYVTITTTRPKSITVQPSKTLTLNKTYLPQKTTSRTRKRPTVTILRPVKTRTDPPKVYIYNNEVNDKPFLPYNPPKNNIVTTTQVPLKFVTTSEIATNLVTQMPEQFSNGVQVKKKTITPKIPAQYYYYEEEPSVNSLTTEIPRNQNQYPELTNYYLPVKPETHHTKYVLVTSKPYSTQKPRFRYVPHSKPKDTFSIHIAKLQNTIRQYYTTQKPIYRAPPKPVYQYSFQASNYQATNNFKPSPQLSDDNFKPMSKYSVQIQQAIEVVPTEEPKHENNNYLHPVFTTPRSEGFYQYKTENIKETVTQKSSNYYQYQPENNIATPTPFTQISYESTPNPVFQGFYTKRDEGYFDDNTKQYFTIFGRKLPFATTPIPPSRNLVEFKGRPYQNKENYSGRQFQQQNRYESQRDSIVSYVKPQTPAEHSDPEIMTVKSPQYPEPVQYANDQHKYQQEDAQPEIIKAIPIPLPQRQPGSHDQQESYISYELPGDNGAHFYFLTPQFTKRKTQPAGYYYSDDNRRKRRSQKTSDKER